MRPIAHALDFDVFRQFAHDAAGAIVPEQRGSAGTWAWSQLDATCAQSNMC